MFIREYSLDLIKYILSFYAAFVYGHQIYAVFLFAFRPLGLISMSTHSWKRIRRERMLFLMTGVKRQDFLSNILYPTTWTIQGLPL